jgi:hypothetical protein
MQFDQLKRREFITLLGGATSLPWWRLPLADDAPTRSLGGGCLRPENCPRSALAA